MGEPVAPLSVTVVRQVSLDRSRIGTKDGADEETFADHELLVDLGVGRVVELVEQGPNDWRAVVGGVGKEGKPVGKEVVPCFDGGPSSFCD